MDVVSTKPVSVSFVKEELLKRQEGGELSYEQSQALEHAENVSPHTQAKIDGLIKDLKKIDGMTDDAAIKVVDIYPKSVSTLKAVLMKDKIELPEEELEKIVKLFK